MIFPILIWYLLLLVVGLASWPISAYLLSSLKDSGYSFSKALGLMLWGFIFWLLTTLGVFQNNIGGVLTSLVILIAVSIWIQSKHPQTSWVNLWRKQTRMVILSELLFLVSFLLIAVWRAANPDIVGTEKPMELAFINSILRSPVFPPADPWLSGYSISYYYFGYVIVSMLIRLSGVTSGVGFNLAAAAVFAMTAISLYGLLFNIINDSSVAHFLHPKRVKQNETKQAPSFGWPLIGPLFTLIMSNLQGLYEFLFARGLFWKQAADGSWVSPFWKWLDIQELNQSPVLPFTSWPSRPNGIIWWRASRVLSDYNLSNQWYEIIDEFPFFSFLLSDLHPHVIALPFVTLALAFGLNMLLGGAKERISILGLDLHLPLQAVISIPIFIGGLAFMNTWDFPIYLSIWLLCYFAARVIADGYSPERIWELIAAGLVVGGLSILFYLPFFLGFKSQAGGIIPSLIFFTRGAHLWTMFGLFFIPIGLFLFTLAGKYFKFKAILRGLGFASLFVAFLWLISFLLGAIGLNMGSLGQAWLLSTSPALSSFGSRLIDGSAFYAGIQGLQGEPASNLLLEALGRRLTAPGGWLTLTLLLGACAAVLFHQSKAQTTESAATKGKTNHLPEGILYVVILVFAGAMIVLIPEYVYLRDQFGWRMNTIFKFYYQAWVVLSIAASFAVIFLYRVLSGFWKWAGVGISVVVIGSGLLYPMIGIYYTTGGLKSFASMTLDGTRYLDQYQPDEAQAMHWLTQAPYGIIAESVGGSYSAHARMSTHSGLPAVIGWVPHEGQWGRTPEQIGSRMPDIERLYNSPSWEDAKVILDLYSIKYVVVGSLERSTYNVDEAKFLQQLPVAFKNDSVTIYEYTGN